MIALYKPNENELIYRQRFLMDEETMSYNLKWGGTIDWPHDKWEAWAEKWLKSKETKYFYRYIQNTQTGEFVGEAAFRYDSEYGMHVISIIVEAKHRGKGYGTAALELLIDHAKKLGIPCLCDDIAADNPGAALFVRRGFREIWRTDEIIMLKLDLREE